MRRFNFPYLYYLLVSVCFFLCITIPTESLCRQGQTFRGEIGHPLIRNYGPKEYRAQPQNSAIVQAPNGLIYVANNSANLLEFDGVRWRHIRLPNQLASRCLTLDEHGRIYVGATNDFGYLAPDTKGSMQFQSLLEKVNPEDRDYAIIYATYATSEGVFFISRERVFKWQNNELQVWQARTAFIKSLELEGRVFIRQQDIGLMCITADSLQLVPGGELFADRRVAALFPYSDAEGRPAEPENMLIALVGEGLYQFEGGQLQPWNCEANDYIKDIFFQSGIALSDSLFGLATAKGAVLFNNRGDILQVIDKSKGLASDMVFSLAPDREGGLWLATLQGIARVNSATPIFTVFDEAGGIDGVVSDEIIRHQGTLYLRTTSGVKYLNPRNSRFEPVTGLTQPDWSPFQYDGDAFAIKESLRKIDGNKSALVKDLGTTVMRCFHSRIDPQKLFIETLNDGLKVLQRKSGQWLVHDILPGAYGSVRSLAEEPGGNLWLGLEDGLLYLPLSPDSKTEGIQRFGVEHGLPKGFILAQTAASHPVFATVKGLFRFEKRSQRFIPDSTFGPLLADGSRGVDFVVEDSKNNLWLTIWEGATCYLNVARRQRDGAYLHERTPFLRAPSSGIWTIFPEDNGIVWFGGEEGLMRFDDTIRREYAIDFPALVRQVLVKGDSLIYGGTPGANEQPFARELKYAHNALRFECAATSFADPSANRFQYFLDGFDEDWSGWTAEPHKVYTNIPEGDYTFRVRAQNVYEHLSSEDSFTFTVLPPWFRTWWAYTLYGLIFFAILYAIRQYEMSRQQFKHEAELQKIEAKQLQETDALKSRFFANISHEFRTPLTLIMGQIDQELTLLEEKKNPDRLAMVSRNAQQLLRLINQLLDLSKLEAGQMTLQCSRQNIVPLLRQITAAFESMAVQKQINLQFDSVAEELYLFYEQDKIEKIMYNLLSNAFKFTPQAGSVLVKVEADHSGSTTSAEETGELKISVRDSGVGIPKDRLPYVFDRFYQVDASTTREYEGTGIGLALTKELVQLHGGGISVTSDQGFGTTFVVTLPLGKTHLKPEQIADLEPADREPDEETLTGPGTGSELEVPVSGDWQMTPLNPPFVRGEEKRGSPLLPGEEKKRGNPLLPGEEEKGGDLILIVEDNPDMRFFISESLEDTYQIVEAANGEEGIETALETIPDLIITDVMMPKMDGYQLTRQLRLEQATSHIPIIMLTAKAADQDKFAGLEQGVDVYLTKPFNKKELRIRVRKLIEMRRHLLAQARQKPMITASEIMITSAEQKFLERLQEIVEANMADESFEVEALCRKVGMSRSQLQRKLSALLDCSPAFYIRRIRLERGKQLLEKGAGGISDVAFQVGYGSGSAFARAFREAFGQAPSDFVRKPEGQGNAEPD